MKAEREVRPSGVLQDDRAGPASAPTAMIASCCECPALDDGDADEKKPDEEMKSARTKRARASGCGHLRWAQRVTARNEGAGCADG